MSDQYAMAIHLTNLLNQGYDVGYDPFDEDMGLDWDIDEDEDEDDSLSCQSAHFKSEGLD